MKIAFDTNVILDAIIVGRPGRVEAQRLLIKVAQEEISGIITANTVTDIYYVVKKALGDGKARAAIADVMTVLQVVAVGEEDCAKALVLPMDDFEDALLALCAKREGVDYVVSRDKAFLAAASYLPVIAPQALLAQLSP